MNLTLALPEELVEEARSIARAQGMSLNALLRAELERITGLSSRQRDLAALRGLWQAGAGRSRGPRWTRDEIHDRALVRRHQRSGLR